MIWQQTEFCTCYTRSYMPRTQKELLLILSHNVSVGETSVRKRYVQSSNCTPSAATHFYKYFDYDSSSHPCRISYKLLLIITNLISILTMIVRAILVELAAQMCRFTSISMASLNALLFGEVFLWETKKTFTNFLGSN